MMIVDSDVLIDALRGREPARRRVGLELGAGALATTSITLFELHSGARTAAEVAKVEALLAPLMVILLDDAGARAAAEVRRTLERMGQGIGTADSLTGNRARFERVAGLKLGTLEAR